MNKKFVALAVAGVLAAPLAAQAEAKLYGILAAEIANEESTAVATDGMMAQGGGGRFQNGGSIEDNKRGLMGVKGDEDLGDGLKAIYKMEWQVSTVNADIDDGDREAFVGLSGGFGTVQVGAIKNPYKYLGGVKYDAFVTTNLEARRYGGMTTGAYTHNAFWDNAISYQNKFGPAKVWVASVMDGVGGAAAVNAYTTAIGAEIGMGSFDIVLANVQQGGTTAGSDLAMTKVGAKMKLGGGSLAVQYETGDNAAAKAISSLFLSYVHKMGSNDLVVQYGSGSVDLANTEKTSYLAVGAWHKFSKTTKAWVGYRSMSVTDGNGTAGADGDSTSLTAGMRINF